MHTKLTTNEPNPAILVRLSVLPGRCLRRSVGRPAQPLKAQLVLAIVIDQFRYDYLLRFRSDYHSGLDRLLTRGAVLPPRTTRRRPPYPQWDMPHF